MAPLPLIVPMQPTSVTRPFHHDGWIYEEKVDGWRVIAYKDGDQVELIGGRSGRDHTKRFPGLAAAIAGLPDRRLILDGEVAIFDKDLKSRFDWLSNRRPAFKLSTPPILMAFDCLWRADCDIRHEPLWYRRVALEEAIHGERLILPTRRLAEDGFEAWTQVLEQGYEGLVGKDQEASYLGGTTVRWLKLKRPDARDVVAPRSRWGR
jgi:bifunctional non-homologous end joining protein LigD